VALAIRRAATWAGVAGGTFPRRMRRLLLLALPALALAACGSSSTSGSGQEAAVLEAVRQSNVTFARGDYAATCALYTERLTAEMVAAAGAGDCESLWRGTAEQMRATMSRAQVDAMTGWSPTSAKVDGDTATATYGEPPAAIAGLAAAGQSVALRKVDGRWRIDRLPQATPPSGSA